MLIEAATAVYPGVAFLPGPRVALYLDKAVSGTTEVLPAYMSSQQNYGAPASDHRVRVGIRVRPELPSSFMKGFNIHEHDGSIDLLVANQNNSFKFDHVFGERASQQDVFDKCGLPICDKVLEGFNGCIFAYGMTGAGKTYTMTGPGSSESYVDRGICMRTASYLFAQAARVSRERGSDSISIRVSVLEIYNESLTDLLRESPPPMALAASIPPPPKLSIVDTPSGVVVPSLYVLPLASEEDALSMLLEADANRVVAEHQLNRSSSRSHVVYTFYITRTRAAPTSPHHSPAAAVVDAEVTQSKLHLVDLAGSERSAKTQSTGVVQKESKYINKSLSFLEQVVLALTQKQRDHIPYRQSKLTYMLKDSLGGSCHTVMIACVWPHVNHVWETLSTLRFSSRMRSIENAPTRQHLFNKEPSSARLLAQIASLKRELALRDTLSGRDAWAFSLSPTQRTHTLRQAGAILALPASREADLFHFLPTELSVHSLAQVHCLVGCLRAAVWEASDRDSSKVLQAIERMIESFGVAEPSKPRNGGAQVTGLGLAEGEWVISRDPGALASASTAAANAGGDEGGPPSPSFDSSPPQGSPQPTLHLRHPDGDGDDEGHDGVGGQGGADADGPLPNPASSRMGTTFADFRLGQGRQLHDAYEDVRAALREERARQKGLVSLVNQRKGAIDALLVMMRDNDNDTQKDSEEAAKERLALQSEIDAAKLEYRAGYVELQLCKKQISEATLLKKRAMHDIVSAFDKLASANRVAL